jgi:hypothetical protein
MFENHRKMRLTCNATGLDGAKPRREAKPTEADEDTDEDITGTSTRAAPSPQAPPSGPITRARARELNYVMVLKNEGYVAGFGLRTNVNL